MKDTTDTLSNAASPANEEVILSKTGEPIQFTGPKIWEWGKFLTGMPIGEWVAISHDEGHVVAHAPEYGEVLRLAKERGEDLPWAICKSEPLPYL